jgi:hypothetical protein
VAEIQIHRGFLPHGHLNQRRGHVVKRFCDIFDLFVKIGLFIGLCLLATILNSITIEISKDKFLISHCF